MSKLTKIECAWCGAELERYPSQIKGKRFVFCNRRCMSNFGSPEKNPDRYKELKDLTNVSRHMRELNSKLNPTRMRPETKAKLREAHLNSGDGKTYTKSLGRHTHRVVMELYIGRSLEPGEVVHHIDGDKRNNRIENLQLFASQAAHAQWHHQHDRKRGDAE